VDNSLASKIAELEIRVADQKPDIIAVTELKPKNGSVPELATLGLEGYQIFTSDLHKPDTRGSCIYIRCGLQASQIQDENTEIYADATWVGVTLHSQDKLLVGCIYRSGSPATAAKYDPELHDMLRRMSGNSSYKQKLIVGDFNHKDIVWEDLVPIKAETPASVNFEDCINDCFLYQHVSFPTRYRHTQTPNTLDLVFSSEQFMVDDLQLAGNLGKSDHSCLTFKVLTAECLASETKEFWLYDKGDYSAMRSDLNID